ncbi:MAG TPA: Rne/Rng family ribonuclease [Geminicoccaceae bacterium]|nr:Rne/Rng family ribonuclease [Geminicoccaceae bacterium]
MTKRMLIDAAHPEETRVVVVNHGQLEDFEFESSTKKQLKGNIYLAKVTRVEPSLQAAFVDYGGNRHGFLAFSEIHPDYYQVPQADRRVLDEAERQAAAAEGNGAAEEADDGASEAVATDPEEEAAEVFDEQARRRSRVLRGYKIQEVIKRRQILLVQVVKEERGNKGAALTTYLSLAGRYSVLMPNTARGGGISRKIANPADRSRLKAIARELEVPEGMGLIIRTAGQERNKLEIRRDYEYSLRLWNDIRERTLQSIAPCTIHEEGALIKRAIRDLYARDIDEVWVEGEEGFRAARKIMSMLTPSRTRRVKLYKEDVPLFHHYGVEERLDALHNPVVDLASGGSIVIHATEALTAIDVNSGRSTRERNIEETALKTNVEAAEEVARQLRLRDIAGLVVIDFIDMADPRNQRAVERKLRDQLKVDRARVQLGRISPFGLLELSRQRLRPSFQELSAQSCPTCHGSGAIRSVESAALQAMRAIELAGMKGGAAALAISLPIPVALYVLNQKRGRLIGLEQRYQITVDAQVDPALVAGEYRLETTEPRAIADETPERPVERAAEPAEAAAAEAQEEDADAGGRRRRRRRRRRKKAGDGEMEAPETAAYDRAPTASPDLQPPSMPPDGAEAPATASSAAAGAAAEPESPAVAAETPRRRVRTRRRRGAAGPVDVTEAPPADAPAPPAAADGGGAEASNGAGGLDHPAAKVAAPSEAAGPDEPGAGPAAPAERDLEVATEASAPDLGPAEPRTPRRARRSRRPTAASGRDAASQRTERPQPAQDETADVVEAVPEGDVPAAAVVDRGSSEPPRRGWWSRFVRKDE